MHNQGTRREHPEIPSRSTREHDRLARLHQLATLGELAGGLAHELKNPLSTVKLNLQLLQEDLAGRADMERSHARIATLRREVDRLAETLDDFLRFAGRMELHLTPMHINRLVNDMVDFFQPQAHAAAVRLHASLCPEDPLCRLDGNLFKQAMLNLMINAMQAMPGGGDLIIRTHVDGNMVFVDVSDTGTGISPEAMPHLFEAYFTTKKGGTGLGLATTRRIIEEHQGHIQVTSEPGRGTNFRLEMPLETAE